MTDYETISAVVFLVILTITLYIKRKSLDTKQLIPYFLYFSMYRTKLGLKLMDSAASKFRKPMIYIGYLGVLLGFAGMLFICYALIGSLYTLFAEPEAAPGVGLVLPFKAKGVFFVPFFYWIISIFVIAVVHEFAHGLIARAHNLKVKSSGFAFAGTGFRGAGLIMILISIFLKIRNQNNLFDVLGSLNILDYYSPDFWLIIGIVLVLVSYTKLPIVVYSYIPIIPAAFVEPDEKELKKRPHKEQLSVFAAGPLSNIAFAVVFALLASFVLAPMADAVFEPDGVKITDYVKGSEKFPAESAGIKIGEIVREVNGIPTPYVSNLSAALKGKKPNDSVVIKTDRSSYSVRLAKNPENESLAYLGAFLEQNSRIKESVKAGYGDFLPNALTWIYGLLVILVVLNLGIGLFNLVPIGPLDGGRMLQLVLHKIFDKERGNKIWAYIGMFFIVVIFVNIVAGFVK